MRVIAGSAKGTPLAAIKGHNTRPILDRVKESLFSIISNSIIDSNIIDLFAGTGGLGIEALSRGAVSCIFVDNNYGAIQVIKKNLEKSSLLDKSKIIKSNVFTIDNNPDFVRYREKSDFITPAHIKGTNNYIIPNVCKKETEKKELQSSLSVALKIEPFSDTKRSLMGFGVILVGAPYAIVEQIRTRESLFNLFKRFVEEQIILPDGIIVLQHKKKELSVTKEHYKIEIYDTRTYGKTQITFFHPCKEIYKANSEIYLSSL